MPPASKTFLMPATLTSGVIAAPAPPMSVFTQPGEIITTEIPRGANSLDKISNAMFNAALLVRY